MYAFCTQIGVWGRWLSVFFLVGAANAALAYRSDQEPFAYGDLERLLVEARPDSVDTFLPKLPAELRSNFILVAESRSLQEATTSKPRVILFNKNASLVLAYSELGKKRDEVEIISFDPKKNSFAFSTLDFPGKTPRLLPAQGHQCTKCHGIPARPNWEPYEEWPGVFGDTVTTDSEVQANRVRALSEILGKGRYAPLIGIVPNDRYYYSDLRNRNVAFTGYLSQLNFKRIMGRVRETPNYEAFRYLLLHSETHCSPGNPIPENLKPLLKQPEILGSRYPTGTPWRRTAGFLFALEQAGMDTTTLPMKYLLDRAGYSVGDTYYAMKTPGQVNSEIRYALSKLDPMIQALTRDFLPPERSWDAPYYGPTASLAVGCARLEELSRESLDALYRTCPDCFTRPDPRSVKAQDLLISKCLRCHESGEGPEIPMGSEKDFRKWLRADSRRKGIFLRRIHPDAPAATRMPLILDPLSKDQYRSVREWVSSVAGERG